MKKLILSAIAVMVFGFANAQEQTKKGKWLVEANTNFGATAVGNTSFQLASFTGASIKDYDENPSYFGLQGGYALFVGKNVSIEPGIRYNISLNNDFYD